jgi:hypothetical protein
MLRRQPPHPAALGGHGRVYVAQRFAVDWEQLDAQGRIYAGAQSDPASYNDLRS